ncbi:DDE_3 domain-containing protein [Durusdinium trenchii]|uniref:DDE_3 domain-containing protein n=1 Tax=Durusdinium trenchii TaxID=1381693 RepID=A0ABP0S1S9_9DINO
MVVKHRSKRRLGKRAWKKQALAKLRSRKNKGKAPRPEVDGAQNNVAGATQSGGARNEERGTDASIAGQSELSLLDLPVQGCATEPRPNDLEAVVEDHHEETEEEDDQDFAALSDEGDDSSTVEKEDGHHFDAGESDGHPAANGLQQGEQATTHTEQRTPGRKSPAEARALGAQRVREHRAKRKKAEDEHAARDCMDFRKWAQPQKTPADAESGATEGRSNSEPKSTAQDKDPDRAKEMPLDEKPILATLQKVRKLLKGEGDKVTALRESMRPRNITMLQRATTFLRLLVVACSLWTMQAKWNKLVINVLPGGKPGSLKVTVSRLVAMTCLADEFIKAGKLADANFFEREAEKIRKTAELCFAAASELELPGTQPMKQQLILINDADFRQAAQEKLAGVVAMVQTQGRPVRFTDLEGPLSETVSTFFPDNVPVEISLPTARRWLGSIGFVFGNVRQDAKLFTVGHEREDVVRRRLGYSLEILALHNDPNNVIIYQDESTMHVNDTGDSGWMFSLAEDDERVWPGQLPNTKRLGSSYMICGFIEQTHGGLWMSVAEFDDKEVSLRESMPAECFKNLKELVEAARKTKEEVVVAAEFVECANNNWWNADKMAEQMRKKALPLALALYPDKNIHFVFDNSRIHERYPSDALRVESLILNDKPQKKPPKKTRKSKNDRETYAKKKKVNGSPDNEERAPMRDGWYRQYDKDGVCTNEKVTQKMSFVKDGITMRKGIATILEERDLISKVKGLRQWVRTDLCNKLFSKRRAKDSPGRARCFSRGASCAVGGAVDDEEKQDDDANNKDCNHHNESDQLDRILLRCAGCKGAKDIYNATGRPLHCCVTRLLAHQPDFSDQGPEISEIVNEAGCVAHLLPKYHCELNPIEMAWAMLKTFVRKHLDRSKPRLLHQLKNLMREGWSKLVQDQERISNLVEHVVWFLKMYARRVEHNTAKHFFKMSKHGTDRDETQKTRAIVASKLDSKSTKEDVERLFNEHAQPPQASKKNFRCAIPAPSHEKCFEILEQRAKRTPQNPSASTAPRTPIKSHATKQSKPARRLTFLEHDDSAPARSAEPERTTRPTRRKASSRLKLAEAGQKRPLTSRVDSHHRRKRDRPTSDNEPCKNLRNELNALSERWRELPDWAAQRVLPSAETLYGSGLGGYLDDSVITFALQQFPSRAGWCVLNPLLSASFNPPQRTPRALQGRWTLHHGHIGDPQLTTQDEDVDISDRRAKLGCSKWHGKPIPVLDHDTLLVPCNQTAFGPPHWILLQVELAKREVVVHESLRPNEGCLGFILRGLSLFLHAQARLVPTAKHSNNYLDSATWPGFKLGSKNCSTRVVQQEDSFSCGTHVILKAGMLLDNGAYSADALSEGEVLRCKSQLLQAAIVEAEKTILNVVEDPCETSDDNDDEVEVVVQNTSLRRGKTRQRT